MPLQENGWIWNLHEFLIYNETTSLSVMEEGYLADVSSFDLPHPVGPIWQYGFHETDVNSNKTWRAWRPLDVNITTAESMIQTPQDWLHDGPGWDNPFWDCYHINSIDKDAEGDFLVSMRYTSTIYKISGRDGSVIWRLGGKQSDFQQDFNFSSQHFARFHSQQRSANENETIISFLDNASDERDRQPATSETSSIKVVSIYDDGQTKRATLLRQLDRPDGGLTKLRGSAQPLSNGGFAAGWSEGGYISEFAPDGRTVFEARFTSDRFNTYRAYKFDFVGTPAEPPVLKTFALSRGSSDSDSDSDEGALADMSTSFFVSWNGATEVHTWDFYVTNNMSMPAYKAGSVKMTTFETTFWTTEFWAYAYAEARDASNRTLGRSDWVSVALAPGKMQREYNESRLALEAGALQAEQRQELSGSGGILRIFPVIAVVGMSLITLGLVGSWAVKRFEFVAALVGGGGFRAHRRSGGVVVKEVNYEWSARRHARFLEDWTQQKDALLKSFAVDIDDDDDCEKGPEELAGEGFVDDGNGRMRHGDV